MKINNEVGIDYVLVEALKEMDPSSLESESEVVEIGNMLDKHVALKQKRNTTKKQLNNSLLNCVVVSALCVTNIARTEPVDVTILLMLLFVMVSLYKDAVLYDNARYAYGNQLDELIKRIKVRS